MVLSINPGPLEKYGQPPSPLFSPILFVCFCNGPQMGLACPQIVMKNVGSLWVIGSVGHWSYVGKDSNCRPSRDGHTAFQPSLCSPKPGLGLGLTRAPSDPAFCLLGSQGLAKARMPFIQSLLALTKPYGIQLLEL